MSWETVKLGDIIDFSNGVNFDKSAYAEGVKLIGVSNFGSRFSPDYDSLDEIKNEVVRESDYLLDGDIVFVRSNGNKELVGRCMLINKPTNKVTYSGFCIRARLKDVTKYDPVYFTYLFKSSTFRRILSGSAVGANIQNLSQGRLSSCMVRIPDYDTQKNISTILYAYDDLIENNQKQIILLEEAVQRLYKEWFVDLRFPGHENTKIVDGVPERWKKVPLGEIIGFEIGGGWGEEQPTEKCDQPAYVIRGTDLHDVTHGNAKSIPYRYHAQSNLASRILQDGDIVFEVSGGSKNEGVARTALITQSLIDFLNENIICASFCKLIRVKDRRLSKYIYDLFQYLRKSGETVKYDKRSASSIVNYRWKDFLEQQMIFVPTEDVLNGYNDVAEHIQKSIVNKAKIIEQAKEARDRLLPKLMSGELEV